MTPERWERLLRETYGTSYFSQWDGTDRRECERDIRRLLRALRRDLRNARSRIPASVAKQPEVRAALREFVAALTAPPENAGAVEASAKYCGPACMLRSKRAAWLVQPVGDPHGDCPGVEG